MHDERREFLNSRRLVERAMATLGIIMLGFLLCFVAVLIIYAVAFEMEEHR